MMARKKHEGGKMNEAAETIDSFDILQLLQYLPHRYPFLMVDRIIEARGNSSGSGSRTSASTNRSSKAIFPAAP